MNLPQSKIKTIVKIKNDCLEFKGHNPIKLVSIFKKVKIDIIEDIEYWEIKIDIKNTEVIFLDELLSVSCNEIDYLNSNHLDINIKSLKVSHWFDWVFLIKRIKHNDHSVIKELLIKSGEITVKNLSPNDLTINYYPDQNLSYLVQIDNDKMELRNETFISGNLVSYTIRLNTSWSDAFFFDGKIDFCFNWYNENCIISICKKELLWHFNKIKKFFELKFGQIIIEIDVYKFKGLYYLKTYEGVILDFDVSEKVIKEAKTKALLESLEANRQNKLIDLFLLAPQVKENATNKEKNMLVMNEILKISNTERGEYLDYLCIEFNSDTSPIIHNCEGNRFGFVFQYFGRNKYHIYEMTEDLATYIWNEDEFNFSAVEVKFDIQIELSLIEKIHRNKYLGLKTKGFKRISHTNLKEWIKELNFHLGK